MILNLSFLQPFIANAVRLSKAELLRRYRSLSGASSFVVCLPGTLSFSCIGKDEEGRLYLIEQYPSALSGSGTVTLV